MVEYAKIPTPDPIGHHTTRHRAGFLLSMKNFLGGVGMDSGTDRERINIVERVILPLIVAVLTAFGTVYAVNSTKSTDQASSDRDRITALERRIDLMQERYETRISALQEQVRQLQTQLLQSELQKGKLELQLDQELNTVQVFSAAFNGIKHPIWMKKVHELDEADERGNKYWFEPMLINEAYAQNYNVSRHKYIGYDDWSVWPDSAQNFYDNDAFVWESKLRLETSETWAIDSTKPDGIQITRRVDKDLVKLPRDEGWAIIGIAYEIGD